MKRKAISGLLLLTVCLFISQITMAQPPPPHPGGSGNQGAAIPIIGIMLMAIGTLGYGIKKK